MYTKCRKHEIISRTEASFNSNLATHWRPNYKVM